MLFFGGPIYVGVALLAILMENIGFISTTLWLSIWVSAYEKPAPVDAAYYGGIYAATTVVAWLIEMSTYLIFLRGGWFAARQLHQKLTRAVLNAPLSFWKDIPVGRVVNRFSQDVKSL
jgi:ABC-type multidrug transport system fused ATPase/permease subunit